MKKIQHYIHIDDNNRIVYGFSTAFEEPTKADICINENGERHFTLFNIINPPLMDINGIYLYKYEDNTIKERTQEEKEKDKKNQPKETSIEDDILQMCIEQEYRLLLLEWEE